ncbi:MULTISPECIES: carboxypeptidase-like regulatory domain-containing protein [Proteiniphilum]|uniref:carboxypeptidase-like regulatory domain-containing protein n=1 Tax=Proteiniphilum TaxID=294702 RepID=UPI001EEC873C|nr:MULTISPECIES: carboxypeptidase-like regulatory domain-containing protein [Proteiniphilum]ULB35591.1 carboxypeptidase-like regulatory domain-containing protein [Proteiniphilum propionicum]
MKHLLQLLLLFCFLPALNLFSGNIEQSDSILVLRGRVLGGDTNQPLPNASITVQQVKVSSVTNQDGYFSIRVPESTLNKQLIIHYLGYENKEIPIVTLINNPNNHITLIPAPIQLSELLVVSGEGKSLIKDALQRIPQNYSSDPNMMVAFYRESVKKGSNYISLVETVLDVYKASYRSYSNDQAKIYIGRKATDISPRDTVLLKFQGGISDALMLDIAKNPEVVFGTDASEYQFHIEGLVNINNKPHYIVSFTEYEGIKDILFRGKIYLDAQTLAFARMEFNMNVEGRKDAANIFIRRKPSKMRVEVNKAHYVVDFIEYNGKWYFNYSSTEVAFRVRWTNRFFGLFATTYTIASEIAITDRYSDNVVKFARDERIHSTDVIAERVEYFLDPNFWGEYNVIEPDQQIADAIKRLSGKLQRRKQ